MNKLQASSMMKRKIQLSGGVGRLLKMVVSLFFSAGIAHSAPIQYLDPAPKKVACIGGSVTWGYWQQLPILEKTYPDHLARLLGVGYQVRNYGFGGATGGVYAGTSATPFINSGEQVGTQLWQPDYIIGGLGINDCNPLWYSPDKYEQGYRDLIAAWRTGGRNPSIWLWSRLTPDFRGPLGVAAYPGNVFGPSRIFSINDSGTGINRMAIQQRVDLLTAEFGLGSVDSFSLLMNRPDLAGDGLHLVEAGLKRLAEINYCRIWESRAKSVRPVLTEVAPFPDLSSPADEWGNRPPWLELHNPYGFGVCLDGLSLDAGPGTSRFDFINSTVLAPRERRIVFLSGRYGQDPSRILHSNFTVSKSGGQVRLLGRNGEVLDAIGWSDWNQHGSLGRADLLTSVVVDHASAHQRLVTHTPPPAWQLAGFDATGWVNGNGGAGQELPARAESQFSKRWTCDQSPVGVWTLSGDGSGWSSQMGGNYLCSGVGSGATVPSWISSVDGSWTVEVRLKLHGTQTGETQGFVLRGGTQHVGGAYTYLFIQSDRVVFGTPYANGAVLCNQPNNDGFHVFRLAYHAPTRKFFVWRDGVDISGRTGGRTRDSSRFNWLAMGSVSNSSTQQQNFLLDYSSYDLSGAYSPATINGYAANASSASRPLVTDNISHGAFDATGATCLLRIPFNVGAKPTTGMKLKMEFDDGFRAWINGVEVAFCNAPTIGTVAPANRDDSRSYETVTLDLSPYAGLIVHGDNLLAVQVFKSISSIGRCFVRASLELQGGAEGGARYFNTPTAGAENGSGNPLPAYAWLIETQNQPLPVQSPLSSSEDSDFDGLSNLLEYAQGSNLGIPNSALQITRSQGQISFQWRDDPEIGWRLMEQTDQGGWRPASITGSPVSVAGSTAGMRVISCVVPDSNKVYQLAAVDEPSLATWHARHFNKSELNAGILTLPDADPDADGLPNFLEFAFATNPRTITSGLFDMDEKTLSISFPDPGMDRGILWRLESSADLTKWNEVPAPTVNGCFIDSQTGAYRLTTRDPKLSAIQGFMRLAFSRTSQ